MRDYELRAIDFIKEICPFIEEDLTSPFVVRQNVAFYNMKYNRKVVVRSGCARIALITSDYVVKFDYDPEEVESLGGCQNEMYLYDIAEREGYAYLFAKISHVQWHGHDFYIMPRVHGINDSNGRGWQYMTAKERAWCKAHSLTDLHCGNFGFREGRICIIDYGFQEDLVEECDSTSYDSESYYDGGEEVSHS